MNSSTKLLSGIALLMSLTAYASAGAMDDLKGNVPDSIVSEIKVDMPAPTRNAVGHMPSGDQQVKYLTSVFQFFVEELVLEFFSEGVTAINIAYDSALLMPANPISHEHSAWADPYTVMVSTSEKVLPGANWETIKEYKVVESELFLAVRSIRARVLGSRNLMEIVKQNDGTFTIKVKLNPWPDLAL